MVTNFAPAQTAAAKQPIHSKGISRPIWEGSLNKKEHALFFLRILKETLLSLTEKSYTHFDAQTTSNCCHGLSILVRELILTLQPIQNELTERLRHERELTPALFHSLPGELIDLSSLYILTIIIEVHPTKGRRTVPLNLQSKGKLGTSFCEKIVKRLQRSFSTFVAENYQNLFEIFNEKKWISFSNIQDWIKFTENTFLRKDRKGVKYASCMFSMQVSLGYLAENQATIAVVNDLMDPYSVKIKGRYVRFLRDLGNGNFSLVEDHSLIMKDEPIIVFGGYAFSNTLDIDHLALKMKPWIHQIPSLILACDIHYPQFPTVADDPNFDYSPIIPKEKPLAGILQLHNRIKGVSAKDPSLFCLSHIFVASKETLENAEAVLDTVLFPSCYIPCPATSKYLDTFQNKI